MTKKEFIKYYRDTMEITTAEATEIVQSVFDMMQKVVAEHDVLNINGFMKIEKVFKEEHDARNPRTGEMVKVPACNKLKATFFKDFKDAVNE